MGSDFRRELNVQKRGDSTTIYSGFLRGHQPSLLDYCEAPYAYAGKSRRQARPREYSISVPAMGDITVVFGLVHSLFQYSMSIIIALAVTRYVPTNRSSGTVAGVWCDKITMSKHTRGWLKVPLGIFPQEA